MENRSNFNKVNSVLKPFIPINEKIDIVNNELADFMFSIIKDKTKYNAFRRNPEEVLRKDKVDVSRIDVNHFKNVVDIILKKIDVGDLGRAAVQNSQKETNEGTMFNFDHSSGSTARYETQAQSVRGSTESTSTGEMINQDKNFAGINIRTTPDEILKHELNLIFFPGQPLVTPALIAKIKDQLNK